MITNKEIIRNCIPKIKEKFLNVDYVTLVVIAFHISASMEG
jgi:hypothetical protein